MDAQPEPSQPIVRATYGELARLFIRLSLFAFGGPVAHIAMAQEEIVERRRWLTREYYLDLVAATNLIPGPNSTETMIHVGYVMRGIPGAIFTGLCFIVPSMLITLVLAIFYVSSGAIPQVEAIFWGLQPIIVAVITVAGYRLIPGALKNRALQALFLLAIGAILLLDIPEVIVMLAAGALYALLRARPQIRNMGASVVTAPWWIVIAQTTPVLVQTARVSVTALDLFWYFLQIGAVLFGSGYVLIAYVQQDLVNTFGWLTSQELLDAVAIGQFTPGPVLTTTTVIGYILAGFPGAIAATVGVFLPAFVLVILTAPLIPRMRRSPVMSAFLDGVNAGVLAAILVTVVQLARAALIPLEGGLESGLPLSILAVALFIVAVIAQIRYKVNATWLIVIGAAAGFFVGL